MGNPAVDVEKSTISPSETIGGTTPGPVSAESSKPPSLGGSKLEGNTPDVFLNVGDNDTDPYRLLSEEEKVIIKRQVDVPEIQLTFFTLFRYATLNDKILMAIAAMAAIIAGAILPLMTVLFGSLTGVFQKQSLHQIGPKEFQHQINKYSVYFVYMGIGEFIFSYFCTVVFIYTGEHIAQKIREQYLKAILRQNIGFFDKLGAGEIITRITADTNLIQEGISEKIGLTLSATATFITAFIIGFVKSWKLTLILMSTFVAIVVVMGTVSRFVVKFNRISLHSYAVGGTVAEEALSSIRNTTAFSTQDKIAKQYDKHLTEAEKWGFKMKTALGFMFGGMFCIIYMNYGLAFWQGSRFLVTHDVDISDIITILLAVLIGSFSLGSLAPNAQAFTTAVSAAAKIYNTIDRESPLDPEREDGEKLESVEGTIELRNVRHAYPSRPEVIVLKNFNLTIPAGKVTALVGPSGSGKSTIVGLVERFYDPIGGQVLLDGHDLRNLNLRWLRQNVSLVQQEPVLFGTTIYENVCHGLIGTSYENSPEEKKKELVVKACEMANADTFIRSLPDGYATNVGERGFLLSGGQKQRIAIARAIVSDPKILLLDEATSALDTRSEGVVQAALDAASQGRTTIVIAHRLSTIKDADNIVVMSNGEAVEQGTHEVLLETKGAYYNLVEAQKIAAATENTNAESSDAEDEIAEKLGRVPTTKDIQEGDPDDEKVVRLNRTNTTKSKSSLALAGKSKEAEHEYSLWTLIKLTASFNKNEKWYMILGLFSSIIVGGGYPTQAVFFAKSITAIALLSNDMTQLRKEANFWAGMYLMLAWIVFLAYLTQAWAFGHCSERLIHRVRDRAFRTMLRQDVAFFDMEENTTGSLTSFLSTQTTFLAGMSGVTLGTILSVTTTLLSALIVGVAIGWKLALVCTSTIPVLLACGFLRFWMLAQFQRRSKKAYQESASFACEAASAIRTVAALTRENQVWDQYHHQLEVQGKKSLISVAKSSTLYAMSQSFMFFCVALGFWYGGTLMKTFEYNMFKFFLVFIAIIFGAQSAGTIFSFAPDMSKAKQAAQELKTLFDRKPEIDSWSDEGGKVESMEGHIEFRDVHFRYPTRPDQPVLRGLDLLVKPGQYVALCGPSGCGKSTTIALIERFYNPLAGGVYVDGREISTLNINEYRRYLALVSQEPTLYQGTIRENILLGAERDDITDEEVFKVCKDANIYDFIVSLPEGFNTTCGSKGTLLSGGQKQRIAIARALIRNPRVLLLDEATSALDSESEKIVQAALDRAAKGRTTIAVAHRLSTIQKADCIYVFDSGRIVESGTHEELLRKKGKYYELVNLQSLEKAR